MRGHVTAAAAMLGVFCTAGPWASFGCAAESMRGIGFVSHAASVPGLSLRAGRIAARSGGGRKTAVAAPLSLEMRICDLSGDFKVGDKVKLQKDLKVYHVKPKDFPDGFTIKKEWVGEVQDILTKNPEITPDKPILVVYKQPEAPPKFVVHTDSGEIQKA
jgi:hypothetical protein